MKDFKSILKRRLARHKISVWKRKTKALGIIASLKGVMKKGRCMEKIEVVTMMYNEAFLAPLFVRHYAPWVDKFTVYYSESADGTRSELETAAAQCGVKSLDIVPFEFPNGFDDMRKIQCINKSVRGSSADFVVCVDADEFVHPWPFESTDPRDELAKETGDVVYCAMFQAYRHATDADIDPTRPPLFQRRHGYPNTDGNNGLQNPYTKPCIVRPDSGAQFGVGCHRLLTPKKGSTIWRGVHWGKADKFCILRYVRDRRDRLSETNLTNGFGAHHLNTTGEKILAELKAGENCQKLF